MHLFTREQQLALVTANPRLLALYLMGCGNLKWVSFVLPITFEGGTLGESVAATLESSKVGCDFIVADICHTIQAPNSLAGSAYAMQKSTNTSQSTYCNVEMKIFGCTNWFLTDPGNVEPLENVSRAASAIAKCSRDPFVLAWNESIKVTATLARTLEDDENPFNVFISFLGWYTGLRRYDDITVDMAMEIIKKHGLIGA